MHALFGISWDESLALPGSFLRQVRHDRLVSYVTVTSGVRFDYYCFPFWFVDLLIKYDSRQEGGRTNFFLSEKKSSTYSGIQSRLRTSVLKSKVNLITSPRLFNNFFDSKAVSSSRTSEVTAKLTLKMHLKAYYDHYKACDKYPLWFAHLCLPVLTGLTFY